MHYITWGSARESCKRAYRRNPQRKGVEFRSHNSVYSKIFKAKNQSSLIVAIIGIVTLIDQGEGTNLCRRK